MTPTFWQQPSRISSLLQPFTILTRLSNSWRKWTVTPYKAAIPVICVGNITMGGAGKTPVVVSLAMMLQEAGHSVHIISRGYGRTRRDLLRVDPAQHQAADVGDEPLLLSRIAPVWVAADRRLSVAAAIEAGAEVVIMDDGLQNPSLVKDLSLLVIDGNYGLGNGRLFPAGPLREPLTAAMKRVSAVMMIGEDKQGIAVDVPVLNGTVVPDLTAITGKRIVPFAGIGHPQKFFTMLKDHGIEIAEQVAFPDHYPYKAEDMLRLQHLASKHNAELVTTEKDAMRLPVDVRKQVLTVPITIEWQQKQALLSWLTGLFPN